jgi:hypothetical protein
MNSSVYGPLFPMEGVFAEMDGSTATSGGSPSASGTCRTSRPISWSSGRRSCPPPGSDVLGRRPPLHGKAAGDPRVRSGADRWLVESGFRPAAYCDFDRLGRHLSESGKRLRRDEIVSSKYAAELRGSAARSSSATPCATALRAGRRSAGFRRGFLSHRRHRRVRAGREGCPLSGVRRSGEGGVPRRPGLPGPVQPGPVRLFPVRRRLLRRPLASPASSRGRCGGRPARSVPAEILTPAAGGPEPGKVLVVGCRDAGLLAELGKRGWDAASAVDAEAVECGRFDRVLLSVRWSVPRSRPGCWPGASGR